ncbi:PEP-CTERM sorting domain-containing protein [Cyanothece sp. BG0011]|uniref:PEP-CTERM sorting domain-containing protein n=1 Tax=Cyanothece sp. BG0011 TaxID=2082950 RepID=UPI000D1E9612|nr:PEP-CTERM sorting domain-containing protein [Cyanothece sp. BG0011]
MIKQIAKLLLPLPLALAVPGLASAAQLGAGTQNFVYPNGIQLLNNAVDFAPNATDFVPLGFGGSFTDLVDNGGTFNINFIDGDGFADFLGKEGLSFDIYLPGGAIGGPNPGTIVSGETYDFLAGDIAGLPLTMVTDGTGASATGINVILYDLDEDGFDTDDAAFYATSFTRTTIPQDGGGGFNVTVAFDGFLYSPTDEFDITPVTFSLFNGVTAINPDTLAVLNGAPPLSLPAGAISSNLDGAQEILESVPEPGTVTGLAALGIFGLLRKRKGNKA